MFFGLWVAEQKDSINFHLIDCPQDKQTKQLNYFKTAKHTQQVNYQKEILNIMYKKFFS